MQNDSYVIRKERCPKCAELGNDKSHDNLAIYSDGHSYCYRCGYHVGRRQFTKPIERIAPTIALPSDVTSELPYEATEWLRSYELTRLDIQQHNILWSDKWSRIIFPYFDDTGLIAWQGRYIGTEPTAYQGQTSKPAKWFSQGKIHEIIHPIKVQSREAVLVEDIVSAIKVSKHKGTIPIFGSTISPKHFLRIKTIVDKVWLWMDPDMRTKSVKMASLGQLLGLETRVIFSDKDPKEESHEVIRTKLSLQD